MSLSPSSLLGACTVLLVACLLVEQPGFASARRFRRPVPSGLTRSARANTGSWMPIDHHGFAADAPPLFNRPPGDPFDSTLARYLAVVSRLTYDPEPRSIRNLACGKCRGFQDVLSSFKLSKVLVSSEDTLAITGVDRGLNAIIVAFRGSSTLKNWFNNIQFMEEGFWAGAPCTDRAMLHAGFKTTYLSLRQDLLREVDHLVARYPDMGRILVTGHSLGGAMAVLASLELSGRYGHRRLAMYSFGGPVVGNRAFAACYAARVPTSHRVVHSNDIVTTLVPMGFYHVPEEQRDPVARSGSMFNFITAHCWYLGVYLGR